MKSSYLFTLCGVCIFLHASYNYVERPGRERKESLQLDSKSYFPEYCSGKKCVSSLLCKACEQKFIFIISMGRAGSTTLMEMFGSLPGVRLAGENNNEMYVASRLVTNLLSVDQMAFNQVVASGSWRHGMIQKESMACVFQELVAAINPPVDLQWSNGGSDIIGFKTIRVHLGGWAYDEAAAFFRDNFPCSKFIVNINSNVTRIVNSRSGAGFPWGLSLTSLLNELSFYRNFSEYLGDQALTLDMSQWKDEVEIINNATRWLGFRHCKFSSLMHENIDGYVLNKVSNNLSCLRSKRSTLHSSNVYASI